MILDAHHHLWRYQPSEYGWIDESMSVLRQDYLPPELGAALAPAGIDGAVTVQARQTLAETDWLLDLAERFELLRGVVGWVPLVDGGVADLLAPRVATGRLVGVRHVLHDEPDERYLLRDDFNRGIGRLAEFGLVYDLLIYERHLPQTIEFVDRHPDQPFVLDHIGKPRIRDGVIEPWATSLRELARRENVSCKLSGVVTEADHRHWTDEQLRPYLETVLEAFGPSRLMYGSDWPVCLLACDYGRWLETVNRFIGPLTPDEQAASLGGTAARVYGLG